MKCHVITPEELQKGHNTFEENEPRDLFYRASTTLVELALNGSIEMSLAEAIAVLLQTWNVTYYRFYGKFNQKHYDAIVALLKEYETTLAEIREWRIEDLNQNKEATAVTLFAAFEEAIGGPTGAAKSLHLLAPDFFPLWDSRIAKAYNVSLGRKGAHTSEYLQFMHCAKQQCSDLRQAGVTDQHILKLIDEYNYAVHTLPKLLEEQKKLKVKREEEQRAKQK